MSCVHPRLLKDNAALAVPEDLASVGLLAIGKVAIKPSRLLKARHLNNKPLGQGIHGCIHSSIDPSIYQSINPLIC